MFVYDKGLDSPGEANKTVEHTRATTSKQKKRTDEKLGNDFSIRCHIPIGNGIQIGECML